MGTSPLYSKLLRLWLSSFHIMSRQILKTARVNGFNPDPHVTGEETEASGRAGGLMEFTELTDGRTRTDRHTPGSRATPWSPEPSCLSHCGLPGSHL